MTNVCPKCNGELTCLFGHLAHPVNWYCKDKDNCGWTAWEKDTTPTHEWMPGPNFRTQVLIDMTGKIVGRVNDSMLTHEFAGFVNDKLIGQYYTKVQAMKAVELEVKNACDR